MRFKSVFHDGFGDRTPACREYTHFRADSDSREFMPPFQNEQYLVQFLKFILYHFLAPMELKFKFHPPQRQIEIPGKSYAEERTASWMSYISEIQDTIPRVMNYFWKDLSQKRVNFVLQSWSNPASRTLMRRSKIPTNPVYTKDVILVGEGSGMTFLLANLSKETLFSAEIWSRWTRNWRRCSLEFYGSETAESNSEILRERILGHGLASTHLSRKQQDEVPILHEFQKIPCCIFVPLKDTLVGLR